MIAEILSNRKVSCPYYEMSLSCPELNEEIKPGQFLMLKVRESYEPFLRRPFSLYGIKTSTSQVSFEILYKVVGFGTRMLSEMKRGEKVDIITPLGNGFTLLPDITKAIIVAGGIGLAPLLFLAEYLRKNWKEKVETIFLYGGRGKADIVDIERIRGASSEVKVCTEDGSMGSRMVATELLETYLKDLKEGGRGEHGQRSTGIFSCGPKAMLRIVSSIAEKYKILCQVSLESFMACGFGACLGCAVKVRQEDGTDIAYERVCKEGPVFDSKRIVWDE